MVFMLFLSEGIYHSNGPACLEKITINVLVGSWSFITRVTGSILSSSVEVCISVEDSVSNLP